MNGGYIFSVEMKVRDYECDLQGVVNNANYQHYMEHARHEYLESIGGNFQILHDKGIDLMVSRVEIDYKRSLKSGDRFRVDLGFERKGARLIFRQDIHRVEDDALIAAGKIHVVTVKDGMLTRGEEFAMILGEAAK